MDQMPRV
jgi:hypothetical protein